MSIKKKFFLAGLLVALSISVFFIFPGESRAREGGKYHPSDAWEGYWNRMQPADKVMDTIGVKPGMMVGEVGAGRGRYAVKIAERIGPEGIMYANDILDSKLDYLNHRCKRDNIPNIVTIKGTVTDPRLPPGKLDFVYMINTYHHLDKPVALLKNVKPALKPEGRLVIIEHTPEKTENSHHNTPKEMVLKQAKEAGFKLLRIETFLKYDNIYIFKRE